MTLRSALLQILHDHGPMNMDSLADRLNWETEVTLDQVTFAMIDRDVYAEIDGTIWLAREIAA